MPQTDETSTRTFIPLLAVLLGCAGNYRPLSVDEINERPPQRPAVITLSDPQIYSRETLVNDRRREADYLRELIEKSKGEAFEPQIRRDLRELTSTVLRLEGAFNPLAGRQAAVPVLFPYPAAMLTDEVYGIPSAAVQVPEPNGADFARPNLTSHGRRGDRDGEVPRCRGDLAVVGLRPRGLPMSLDARVQ